MAGRLELTNRDRDLLFTLTHRVRCLSLSQAGRVWWPDSPQPAREAGRRLTALAARELVLVYDALARPEIDLSEPVAVWRPGNSIPDFGALAYRFKVRWQGLAARRVRLVVATKQATKLMGGHGGRRPRATEVTHDIHLATVYCHHLVAGDRRIKKWVSEAELYRRGWGRGEKLPDALIMGNRGKHTVIELAGEYSAAKLEGIHTEYERRRLAYLT